MGTVVIGILHPGEMGSAVAKLLRDRGHEVVWASAGRSSATKGRAEAAGLVDVGGVADVVEHSDVILSICPPHGALELARQVAGFGGVYVDANAVSPQTVRTIAGVIEGGGGMFVDGGIVGAPPRREGTTRLYLSAGAAERVTGLFAGTVLDARIVSDQVGAASALKMAYAGWSKGSAALLLTLRALARSEGVEDALLAEWRLSVPHAAARSQSAATSAAHKGWRWVAEMQEIAATLDAAGLPDGFHQAAAAIFARAPRIPATEVVDLDVVVDALNDQPRS
jgi:3-hydroxyisobutyrate dehydrogenase-like beta-hydroxyacid dehydrogenase